MKMKIDAAYGVDVSKKRNSQYPLPGVMIPGVCRNTGLRDLSGSIGTVDRAMTVVPGASCGAVFLIRPVF